MVTALYRRYRPETFAELIGQSQVTDPLRTALRTDRVNHAYLFSGPRGCGKTTSARILARCLNCAEGPTDTPCGVCAELRRARPRRRRLARRRRDRRGQPQRRRRRPRPARARRLRPGPRPLQDLHPRRGAHGDAAGLQRAAQDRRRAAGAREVHLRDDRAREGHRHDPLAAPTTTRSGSCRPRRCSTTCSSSARPRASTVEPGVLPLVVRAGGGSVRDTLSLLDQLIAGSEGTDGRVRARRRAARLHPRRPARRGRRRARRARMPRPPSRRSTASSRPGRIRAASSKTCSSACATSSSSPRPRDGAAAVLRGIPQDELDADGAAGRRVRRRPSSRARPTSSTPRSPR